LGVEPTGLLSGGTLERVASRLAIAAAAAQAAYRGEAPNLLRLSGTDLDEIRSGTLAEAIEAGDEVIADIVREAARAIGSAVAGVVHLLSPDVVILGGGLVEAMPDLFVDGVRDAARNSVLPTFVDSFTVVAAQLGDEATSRGAAAWACELISNRPAT
ncbi:MAG: ROK family protein, partial [Planctomycetia bacterium]